MKLNLIFATSVLAIMAGSSVGQANAQDKQAACQTPKTVQGFKTCADLDKARKEGTFVVYSPDVEQGTVAILNAFHKLFPKIETSYIRRQTGALYAKLMSERQARSYLADVLNLSDMSLVRDFQKRGGYARYLSPQLQAYKTAYKSQPEGYWTWGSVILAGIAYNPKTLKASEAPKDWADLLDPRWKGKINVKSSNSGLQNMTWYTLRKKLGKSYWSKFAKQNPRPFDSYVQQYDRVVSGEDEIVGMAQYSGYLQYIKKGAPLKFVVPAGGEPAGPEVWGVVSHAKHPAAARLFLDWFLSPLGQKAASDALFMNSPRSDVAAPPGGKRLTAFKLLTPSDWKDFVDSRGEFVKRWNTISGLQ